MQLCAPPIEMSPPARRHRRPCSASAAPRRRGRGFARHLAGRLQHAHASPVGRTCRASYASATPAEAEPESAWWEAYGDPVLSDLIRRAARENRDVRIAAERVQAARAGETISRSALVPNVGASAGAIDASTGLPPAPSRPCPT